MEVADLMFQQGGKHDESIAIEHPLLLKEANIWAIPSTLAGSNSPVIYAIVSRGTINQFWSHVILHNDGARPHTPLPANHKFI